MAPVWVGKLWPAGPRLGLQTQRSNQLIIQISSRQEFMSHSSKKVVVVNMFPVVWEETVSAFEMIA